MRLRFFSLTALLVAVACGGDGDDGTGPGPSQTLESIAANPPTLSLAAGATGTVSVTGTDTNGQPVSGLTNITLTSQNAAIAEVSGTSVLGISSGSTTITVSATKGSVTKTTSITATVTGTLPNTAAVTAGTANVFTPGTVVIAQNGQVAWSFGSVIHNVTFAAVPNAPPNIQDTSNQAVSRTFATKGNFAYQCTIHAGMSGTVLVR